VKHARQTVRMRRPAKSPAVTLARAPGNSSSPSVVNGLRPRPAPGVHPHRIPLERRGDVSPMMLGLQQSYGNHYVQRLMALARTPEGGQTDSKSDTAPAAVTKATSVTEDAGGCPTKAATADSRVIRDNLCLHSAELAGDSRLNDAFHNNPPLTARDGSDAVRKLQQALLNAGELLPKSGADGKWGDETTRAIASFQGKNGVPRGGSEAGRRTLLALDARLQQIPPKPVPPSPPTAQTAQVTTQCGQGQATNTVVVTGTGFTAGPVKLTVNGADSNGALADATGKFTGGVPSELKDGTHTVEASGGGSHAAAQFTTPCGGGHSTPVDPNLVTQNELMVLTKYQFMGQTERDATEDAFRDLKGKLDQTPVSWLVSLAEIVLGTAIQFVYGEFEQIIRTAVKSLLPAAATPGGQDPSAIVDNANDKASDFLEDFGKDGLKKAMDDEDQKPTKKLEEQVEAFRRAQLKSLREGYLNLETGWIAKVQGDAKTASITPDELQGLGTALDQTSGKIYKTRYDKTVEAWASYISNQRLGGATITSKVPGRPTQVQSVTNLTGVGDKDPKDVPGVLLIGLIGGGGKKGMPDTISEMNQQEEVHVNPKEVHIFGLSEDARKALGNDNPPLAQLTMPVVLRGEPRDGGFVAIGREENGGLIDAGSDKKGKTWLVNVGRAKKLEKTLSDPGEGARAVFQDDLSAATTGNAIQGP
jgi:Putative peptidoglycan binding domain